jgi:hypothetical protein
LVQLLKDGHVPDFMRNLSTVEFKVADAKGIVHTVKYQVTPDYLAVGTNEDYVFVPMSSQMAQEVAVAWGMSPPTAQMVDQLSTRGVQVQFRNDNGTAGFMPYNSAAGIDAYAARNKQVAGEDYTAGYWNTTGLAPDPNLVMTHGELGGGPVGGHMKDFVMTESVTTAGDRAVQQGDTTPDKIGLYLPGIQNERGPGKGVPADHDQYYADYSQGLRLVSPMVEVDGTPVHIQEVLAGAPGANEHLYPLLSGEGAMDAPALHAERDKK